MTDCTDPIQAQLTTLHRRFLTMNQQSRTVRLSRCTRGGAFDLVPLLRHAPNVASDLLAKLGHSESGTVALLDRNPVQEEAIGWSRSLGTLSRHARDDWLETGLKDLAIGWPFIEGRAADGTWIRGPLFLYPVWIEATSSGRLHWRLSLRGEPQLNESLAQTIKRLAGAGITLDALLEEDDDRIFAVDTGTWAGIMTCLTQLGLPLTDCPPSLPKLTSIKPRGKAERDAAELGRFRMCHHLILGRFPPSGSSLVGDYDTLIGDDRPANLGRAIDLLSVDISRGEDKAVSSPSKTKSDSHLGAEVLGVLPLASDSSQDQVLAWLDSGDSAGLVVQGPPGTGKSQLIANLLSLAIERNLRCLVVCEKRAALDVVAARLGSVGLGEPLALVHDVVADRNQVCRSIARSIDLRSTGRSSGSNPLADATIDRIETRLRLTQEAFHTMTRSPKGIPSLAELNERSFRDDDRPLPDLGSVAAEVTEKEAYAILPLLEAMSRETEGLAEPHPLAYRDNFLTYEEPDFARQRDILQTILERLRGLVSFGAVLSPETASKLGTLWSEARPLLELFDAKDAHGLNRFLMFWVWTGGHAIHGEWHQVLGTLRRARNNLSNVPYELILQSRDVVEGWLSDFTQLREYHTHWYRGMVPRFWRVRKTARAIVDSCPSFTETWQTLFGEEEPDISKVEKICEEAIAWQDLNAAIPLENPFLDYTFQGGVDEIEASIQELGTQTTLVRAVHRLREALRPHAKVFNDVPQFSENMDLAEEPFIKQALAEYRCQRDYAHLVGEVEDARHTLDPGFMSILERVVQQAHRGHYDNGIQGLEAILASWDDIEEAKRLDQLTKDLPTWAATFLRGWRHLDERTVGEDAIQALERGWRDHQLAGRSRRTLEAPLHDDALLDALAEDIAAVRSTAPAGVLGRYHTRINQRLQDENRATPLRLLHSECKRRSRRLTLRQLAERFWEEGLADVRPVWLCSPDSVASIFPLKPEMFDLVIFDEASQCPVESAIPVALRGKRLMVAGDSQQMPPTRFFFASHGVEDDDGAVLTSESLLDLAAIAYPTITLSWHYRSRHESLAAFSNAAFYGGRLVTAPRAGRMVEPEVEGIHWVDAAGLWEEQRNPIEAARTVDVVLNLLESRTPSGTPPSVGVVTFNLKQAECIDTLLYERMVTDPRCRRLLGENHGRPATEQLFVRNLENVQGDERDVIVFSTGYGPSEVGGPVAARFGPLGQSGGGKRLNVAITRAKLGIWVVSSISPSALQVENSKNPGPKLLKAYLAYAEAMAKGDNTMAMQHLAAGADLGGHSDAQMNATPTSKRDMLGQTTRDLIAERLRAEDFAVFTNHGIGHQRLDIAVGTDIHDLKIAIDTASFLAEDDPLTRDVYRRGYWNRLGWRLLRVTPGMWADSPDDVISWVRDPAASNRFHAKSTARVRGPDLMTRLARFVEEHTSELQEVKIARGFKPLTPTCLSFFPDGTGLLCGTKEGLVAVWDLTTAQCKLIDPAKGQVVDLCASKDAEWLISADMGQASIRRMTSSRARRHIQTISGLPITCISSTTDAEHLVAGTYLGDVSWVDTAKGETLDLLRLGQKNPVSTVKLAADDQVLVGTRQGRITLWKPTSNEEPRHLKLDRRAIEALVMRTDGRELLAGDSHGNLTLWNVSSGKITQDISVDAAPIVEVGYMTATGHIIAVSRRGEVKTFGPRGGEKQTLSLSRGAILDACLSPDGGWLALIANDRMELWNTQTRQCLLTGAVNKAGYIAWTPKGFFTASEGEESHVSHVMKRGAETDKHATPLFHQLERVLESLQS
jgi:WD40 repeat protein